MALTEITEALPKFASVDLIDPISLVNNVVPATNEQKNYGWFGFRKRPERNVMNWLHRQTFLYLRWLKETFFVEVDTAIGDINTDITNLDGRVGTAEGNITSLDGRVDTAETDINTAEGNINSLVSAYNGLNGRVGTAEGNITSLDGRIDTLEATAVTYHDCHVIVDDIAANPACLVGLKVIGGFKHLHLIGVYGVTASTRLQVTFDAGNIPAAFLPDFSFTHIPVLVVSDDVVDRYSPGALQFDTTDQRMKFMKMGTDLKYTITGFSPTPGNYKGFATQTVVYR